MGSPAGPNRARQLLKPVPEVEEILSHRYAVMNVWRRWDGKSSPILPIHPLDLPSIDPSTHPSIHCTHHPMISSNVSELRRCAMSCCCMQIQ